VASKKLRRAYDSFEAVSSPPRLIRLPSSMRLAFHLSRVEPCSCRENQTPRKQR
jgi:hypothetical protein